MSRYMSNPNSISYGAAAFTMMTGNGPHIPHIQQAQTDAFDENMLMDDLDIDELLECDDIEQTAFINSSKHLLSVIDNVICSIDDRINSKRQNFYGGGATGYYGANMGGVNGPMMMGGHEDFAGMGSFSQKNNYMGGGAGYHKNHTVGHHGDNKNLMGLSRGSVAADNFDKTRKISVLY